MNLFKRFRKKESGQGIVEYGLILALISVVSIGSLGFVGDSVNSNFVELYNIDETDETSRLINGGYIPVATSEELANIHKRETRIFGQGTKWEKTYTSGLDKKYIQTADIDLSSITNFEPIGSLNNEFTGIFDGGDYIIEGLSIDRTSEDFIGFFGYSVGSTFKNIGLENVDVRGSNRVGGLIGHQSNSSVINCYITGKVSGNGNYVGGLVGLQQGSSVKHSNSKGEVTGNERVGGLVGQQSGTSMITNSYATDKVLGVGNSVGGLLGLQTDSSSVVDSYAIGNVSSDGNYIGGLVGLQQGSLLTNSYARGKVDGHHHVGGLVGQQNNSSNIRDSYATGNVYGSGERIGGLLGYQIDSKIVRNYATGTATGIGNYTGGLVGYQIESSIDYGYATGKVTGSNLYGGLLGRNYKSTVTNSVWANDINSVGIDLDQGDQNNVTGQPKSEIDNIIKFFK